jgi:hypothetical protein
MSRTGSRSCACAAPARRRSRLEKITRFTRPSSVVMRPVSN